MFWTACWIIAAGCASSSTSPTPAGRPTTCSACSPCWASASRRDCATSGTVVCTSSRCASSPPILADLVGGLINVDLIEKHWDELLRLAVSVGAGHVSASAALQRLAAYPRQNSLALALREVGRLQRSVFMLEWLRSPELRRRAGAGLNKGEARNALARACSSTVSANCAIAPSRTRSTVPPA